eukprot:scaffold23090_cov65-Phaeocystis_antarctica.AAC.18
MMLAPHQSTRICTGSGRTFTHPGARPRPLSSPRGQRVAHLRASRRHVSTLQANRPRAHKGQATSCPTVRRPRSRRTSATAAWECSTPRRRARLVLALAERTPRPHWAPTRCTTPTTTTTAPTTASWLRRPARPATVKQRASSSTRPWCA